MTSPSNSPFFLWEALSLGNDACRAAARDVHRILQELGEEGLHLLRLEPSWKDARDCLDLCVLLELPFETCRRRLVPRKIAGGRQLADAHAHFERVDLPTLEELQDPALRERADLLLALAAEDEAGGPETRTCPRSCERREHAVESAVLRAIPPGDVHLLAVGLNPALQKTLVFDHWERGQVNRAREVLLSVGGKGQQFSRAASHLMPGRVTLAQFLGGKNGERLGRMIESAAVNQITVEAAAETRCCLTVIDAGRGEATEFVEPAAPILPSEAEQLLSRILQTLARGETSGPALCGTYPPGVSEAFYAAVARSKGKAILLLDSYQGIAATLATGHVDILKVNAHELRILARRSGDERRPDGAPGVMSFRETAHAVFSTHQLRWLAVTEGPHTAWLFERPCAGTAPCDPCVWRFYEFHLPRVEGVVNPIGAGDTVGAIFLAQLAATVNRGNKSETTPNRTRRCIFLYATKRQSTGRAHRSSTAAKSASSTGRVTLRLPSGGSCTRRFLNHCERI